MIPFDCFYRGLYLAPEIFLRYYTTVGELYAGSYEYYHG